MPMPYLEPLYRSPDANLYPVPLLGRHVEAMLGAGDLEALHPHAHASPRDHRLYLRARWAHVHGLGTKPPAATAAPPGPTAPHDVLLLTSRDLPVDPFKHLIEVRLHVTLSPP